MNAQEFRERFKKMMEETTDDEIVADFVAMGYTEVTDDETSIEGFSKASKQVANLLKDV